MAVVLLQLVLRLINGAPSRALMDFGDGLSQYLAQIGRFGSFHSDEKPWPFADWPAPREPQVEGAVRGGPGTRERSGACGRWRGGECRCRGAGGDCRNGRGSGG